jgi:uncharacterized protein YbjT (DUF2867 family)
LARVLIIGCGCRGQRLAGELRDCGHVVRGTTRWPERLPDIQAAGAEAVLADPDRLATLVPALDHVSVAVILLGSAAGPPDQLEALHGPRLEALLVKLLDTTIRGVVYEVAGTVPNPVLSAGASAVRRHCSASMIPYGLIESEPGDPAWLPATLGAVSSVLEPPLS